MRKSPRQRRLEADYRSLEKLSSESTIFRFQASGDPPNRYRLQFDGPGISRDSRGKIHVSNQHEVILELGASYPRMVPNLLWQTPIFHPNISNNGVVCLGGYGTHWVPSLTLDEMSTMLWDMIRYENFDIQSPYNREAALWARDQKHFKFPLDRRDIRDLVVNPKIKSVPVQASNDERLPKRSDKGVMGVLGAIANRIRERRERADTPADALVAVANDDVEVIPEQPSLETVVADESPSSIAFSEESSRSEHVSESMAVEVVEPESAIPVEVVEIINSADPTVVEVSDAELEPDLVDPSEIEVITDGITFLDSSDSSESMSSIAQPTATPTLADDNDTGIVFLD